MKKFFSSLCLILVIFSLVTCNQVGKANNIIVTIGESSKFSKEEINAAVNSVKNNFKFPACTLTKIWYDEEKSNSFIEDYLKNRKDSVNGVNPENVIVLLSNFYVDDSGDNPVLNKNSTYTDYNWILIRNSKTSNWKIDDYGY